jgi:hypothetical protein
VEFHASRGRNRRVRPLPKRWPGRIRSSGGEPSGKHDDLELIFQQPLSAFGFDHFSQSADGYSFTNIQVFNQFNSLLYSRPIPISNLGGGGAAGGADFWGVTTTGSDMIGRIVVDERDDNAAYPDCNIGFDTFRFESQVTAIPEPSSFVIFAVGMMLCAATRVRRSKRAK